MNKENEYKDLLRNFMLFAFDKLAKPFEDGRESILGARGFYTLYILGTYSQKTMTELGEACNMKKQQTTKVVDNLTQLGFAQRLYNKNDRRIIQIVITEKGREFLNEQIESGVDRLMKQILAMDETTQEKFFAAVEIINPVLKSLN